MVSTGRETGFLPGSVEAKMKHWLQPMTDAAARQGSQVQLTDD
jgi:predicted ribonuclease YlaK